MDIRLLLPECHGSEIIFDWFSSVQSDNFENRPLASFSGYTIVFNNRFQVNYNITITLILNFRQQVDWLYNHNTKSCMDQNLSNLDLKLRVFRRENGKKQQMVWIEQPAVAYSILKWFLGRTSIYSTYTLQTAFVDWFAVFLILTLIAKCTG